jgi:hypothetical protein
MRWARDRPHSICFLFLTSLEIEGRWRADKAHGLDRQAGCGPARGRALGVKRHAPRLAARQRASSAYASSTVGPARSCLSLGGFIRASPVGRFASSPSRRCPPAPRLTNASGRRPSNTDRDRWPISKFHYEVKRSNLSCDGPWRWPESQNGAGRPGFAPEDRIRPRKNDRQVALISMFRRVIRWDNLSGSHIHRTAMRGR